jgi:hypothetical protein
MENFVSFIKHGMQTVEPPRGVNTMISFPFQLSQGRQTSRWNLGLRDSARLEPMPRAY